LITQFHALLSTTGPDPSEIATHFGKRTKKRIEEIVGIANNNDMTTFKAIQH
jgi:hypothetical protein